MTYERAPVVGLSGSYGGVNLGDEAILASAVAQLRSVLPGVQITVFSRGPEYTKRHHDVKRVVPGRSAMREEPEEEVWRLDLLLKGGGILYDPGGAELPVRRPDRARNWLAHGHLRDRGRRSSAAVRTRGRRGDRQMPWRA